MKQQMVIVLLDSWIEPDMRAVADEVIE